ncbi:MAG TPA: hypothetical protein O0X34_03415 [Methanocorpusculum sp.]|jgi:hypothetical protein|nr:hypothetical protein [Methanocorpusculum sp.]
MMRSCEFAMRPAVAVTRLYGFSESDDYNAVTMGLSKQFVMSMERLRERLTD